MIITGLVLLAAAVAAAAILIEQNRAGVVRVHAFGHAWTGHLYWVLVVGMIIALAVLLGLTMSRRGATRARRRRRELAQLVAENERLAERVGDPDHSPFFSGDAVATDSTALGAVPTEKTRSRRGHHAA